MYDDFLEGRSAVSEEVEEEAEQQFAAEEDLREFVARNPRCIESKAVDYINPGHESMLGFAVETGRIDLLAVDKNQKFVVVELKLGKGRDKALGQILRYMGWVDENLGKGPCRGIIIAKDIDTDDPLRVRQPYPESHCAVTASAFAAKHCRNDQKDENGRSKSQPVTPTKTGVHGNATLSPWIPAFAGMTI